MFRLLTYIPFISLELERLLPPLYITPNSPDSVLGDKCTTTITPSLLHSNFNTDILMNYVQMNLRPESSLELPQLYKHGIQYNSHHFIFLEEKPRTIQFVQPFVYKTSRPYFLFVVLINVDRK